MPYRELHTIYSGDKKRRAVICERDDGSFGFFEEYYSEEPYEHCWLEVHKQMHSICDSEEIAIREAVGRIAWLESSSFQSES